MPFRCPSCRETCANLVQHYRWNPTCNRVVSERPPPPSAPPSTAGVEADHHFKNKFARRINLDYANLRYKKFIETAHCSAFHACAAEFRQCEFTFQLPDDDDALGTLIPFRVQLYAMLAHGAAALAAALAAAALSPPLHAPPLHAPPLHAPPLLAPLLLAPLLLAPLLLAPLLAPPLLVPLSCSEFPR